MGVCFAGIIGECESKSKSDITNITSNDVSVNNSIKTRLERDCSQQALQSNTINIIGSVVKRLNAKQKNSLQSMCIMQTILKSNISSDVSSKLLEKVATNLETKGALLGAPATNETIVKNITNNKTAIDSSKQTAAIQRCLMTTTQKNILNIIGSNVEDTTTDQANEAFLKCLSQYSDDTGVTTAALADTVSESETKSKTSGGDIGESYGAAAKGMGEAVGSAGKGLGEGVGTAGKGIGEGLSAAFGPAMIASVIGGISSLIILAILAFFILSNPDAAGSFKDIAYKN